MIEKKQTEQQSSTLISSTTPELPRNVEMALILGPLASFPNPIFI